MEARGCGRIGAAGRVRAAAGERDGERRDDQARGSPG
jgi:hypothetical protein